jgi:hypothetical protein
VATNLPAGPKGHWLFGSLPDFTRDQLAFHLFCASKYGDVVPYRLGHRRMIYVFHPDIIEEVLVTKHRDFGKSVLGLRMPLLGNGLLLSEGEF